MKNYIKKESFGLRNHKLIIISIFVLLIFFSSCHNEQSRSNSFFKAVQTGDIDKVKLLINKGVDVNAKQNDRFGYTPLITAVENHRRKIIELLLANGRGGH